MRPSLAASIAVIAAAVGAVAAQTPTSTTQCAAIYSPPPAGPYVYKSCMTDSPNNRVLDLATASNASMTPALCAQHCSSLGYPVMGVEYADECYCGTYVSSSSTTAPQSDCDTPCAGDQSQICGGTDRMNVYALANYTRPTIPRTAGGYIYVGCYTDNTTARALGSASLFDYANMTVEKCAGFCSSGGYLMFGTEYSGQCWCANAVATGNSIAPRQDAECTSTCPGNAQELACGGFDRLNVYTLLASA